MEIKIGGKTRFEIFTKTIIPFALVGYEVIITNSLVGYFITSYPTRAHGIIVIYCRSNDPGSRPDLCRCDRATTLLWTRGIGMAVHAAGGPAITSIPSGLRVEILLAAPCY